VLWYHRSAVAGNSDEPSIDALIAAGRHAEAALAASAAGHHARAAEIYERLWDFRGALGAARAGGDLPRTLRYAVELGDPAAVGEAMAALTATDDGARAALDVLVRLRRHAEAAPLAERLGDTARAIELYGRAHKALDAARLLEAAGRDRDAGRLLERALDLAADGERGHIQLALGRILARRGAYPEATRLLQDARKEPGLRAEAQRHLIATLAAMGLRDGARDALLELRGVDPAVPADLDQYLRTWRDQTTERKTGRDREVIANRYRLDRLLGAGASGRVFLASDEVAGRSVAIKMFFAAGARGGAAYERFVREARLASTLRHPSLVEVYDVSVERGFLVMEYLPGGSLAQRLAAGDRLTAVQARRMALDVIAGLEAAHHRGVVHRDVKPANVFFDARGTAKLGDFGVAHLVDLGQTQTGGLIGTLAYMSPEQITGAPISIAADLYALGITLFEAVTGRLPFLGPDFVAQHLGEAPPGATAVHPELAPGWDPILADLLVKNPRDRTPTLGDLRHQLEALDLGGQPRIGPRRRRTTGTHSIAELADEGEARPRYQFETPLGRTAISELARAVDTVLDRSVVIERFDASDEALRALDRARLLGRAQSPFVQRALSLDRATRTAVFEAPAGASLADASPNLPPAETVRMLKRLARAAAAIHELGGSHGAISPRTIVLDDGAVPTVIAAGLGPVAESQPADDVAAIIAVVAEIAGAEPSFEALARMLTDEVGAELPRHVAPVDGESLYAAADAIDVAVLAALGSR
jgi:tRNA A-37 threonylcarbamoyl transferase component Bud32/tetratricopeptide (TPR) repeat protein